ncbi:hypothetical protein EON80_08220 [bacterium]|nr:MAG: hypothetical protein EON80_08220 [bacterium]
MSTYVNYPKLVTGFQTSDAKAWLKNQRPHVSHINVSYGSGWPGSLWKHISVHDPTAIHSLLNSIECKGSLTNTSLGKDVRDDGFLRYNTTYNINLSFKGGGKLPEALSIIPSNDRPGTYFLLRYKDDLMLGWAEMNQTEMKNFLATLHVTTGKRGPTRRI